MSPRMTSNRRSGRSGGTGRTSQRKEELMPNNRRDYDKEFQSLMNALADSVLRESAEELANDLHVEGIEPNEYAERLRQAMLDSIKAHRQQALTNARRSYRDSVASYEQHKVHLPTTPAKRRAVF